MADLRAALKGAQEAIKEKNYKEVLRRCKEALKYDKKNYTVFVYIGLAAGRLDPPQLQQAEQAYRKAVEIHNTAPQAWQGLLEIYTQTKEDVKMDEVLRVLVDVTTGKDEQRNIEYRRRLAGVCEVLGKRDEALARWHDLVSVKADPSSDHDVHVHIAQLTLAIENDRITEEVEKRMVKEMRRRAKGASETQTEDEGYVRSTLQAAVCVERLSDPRVDVVVDAALRSDLPCPAEIVCAFVHRIRGRMQASRDGPQRAGFRELLVTTATDLARRHPVSPIPFEVLMELTEEKEPGICGITLARIGQRLAHSFPRNAVGTCYLGMEMARHHRREEAQTLLDRGLQGKSTLVSAWATLAEVHLAENSFQQTLEAVRNGEQAALCKENEGWSMRTLRIRLQLAAAHAYRKGNATEKAKEAYQRVLLADSTNTEALQGLALLALSLRDPDLAREHIQSILSIQASHDWALSELGWLCLAVDQLEEAHRHLEAALSLVPTHALHLHRMGVIMWHEGGNYRTEKEHAYMHLLQSAKLDPGIASNFTYLGHWYLHVEKDEGRARRCYAKAVSLDPLEGEAGEALGDLYRASGQRTLEVNLYNEVSERSPRAKWAWVRLAFEQHRSEEYQRAMISFQHALRVDPSDVRCWIGLAETYRLMGKYVASVKAFEKALELRPDSTLAECQLAGVRLQLGLFDEAACGFMALTTRKPDFLPGWAGWGEALLSLARVFHKDGMLERAMVTVCQCETVLLHASRVDPTVQLLWKLLGDAYSFHEQLQQKTSSTRVDPQLATKAYARAIHIHPSNPGVWYDAGVVCFGQAQQKETDRGLVCLAKRCFRSAATLDPHDAAYLNALGLVETDRADLRQHFFILSAEHNPKAGVPLDNLGLDYLRQGHVKRSARAFTMSQTLDSSRALAWIGLGLLNQTLGTCEGNALARQSFLHALDLQPEHNAARNLFARSLAGSEKQNGTRRAIFFARKSVECSPGDAAMRNTLALLLEANGEYASAVKELQIAVDLLSREDPPQLQWSQAVHGNLGRVWQRLDCPHDALAAYQRADLNDSHTWRGLAAVYASQGMLQEVNQALQKALSLSQPGEGEAEVLVLLVQLMYYQNDFDGAKRTIVHVTGAYPTYRPGWVAMYVLGLLTGDLVLASTALSHVVHLSEPNDPELLRFLCELCRMQRQDTLARNFLLKAVHAHPRSTELWSRLAVFLMDADDSLVSLGALSAFPPGGTTEDASLLLYVGAANLLRGTSQSKGAHRMVTCAVSAFKRYLHQDPQSPEGWSLLALALHTSVILTGDCEEAVKASQILQYALTYLASAFLRQPGTRQSVLRRHYLCLELAQVDLLLLSRKTTPALERVLKCLESCDPAEPSTAIVHAMAGRCYLEVGRPEDSFIHFRKSVELSPDSPITWQDLANALRDHSAPLGAEKAWQQALNRVSSQRPTLRFAILVRLAELAHDTSRCDRGLRHVREALKVLPGHYVALLLQGFLYERSGQSSRAEKSFAYATSVAPPSAQQILNLREKDA